MANSNRKIIRLHNVDNNTVAVFSTDDILYVNQKVYENNKVHTVICTYTSGDEFAVNESVDKIYALISGYGFVRCHRNTDNTVELFNTSYFVMCFDDGEDVVVRLENNIEMSVNESPERIYNMIIDADIFERRTEAEYHVMIEDEMKRIRDEKRGGITNKIDNNKKTDNNDKK